MPWLSTPQSVAGLRFETTTTLRPTRSSGLYHFAMPEATVRGVPVPSFSVSFRSFLARLIGSQAVTSATVSSTFAKSSIVICATPGTASFFGASAGAGFGAFFASTSAIFASISFTSMRAKRISGFSVTLLPFG